MAGLDDFWRGYDATLARVRLERPSTTAAVVEILNAFQPPSAGIAFFGNNADEHLSTALAAAGWDVRYIEGDYLWEAHQPTTGAWLHNVEGDVYDGQYAAPPPWRPADPQAPDEAYRGGRLPARPG
jgi:hypothetical protein